MPLVMNATSEPQHTQVFGNHFSFKPGQIKMMNPDIADFLIAQRAYQGFVGLSEKLEDLQFQASPDGQAAILEAKREGVDRYLEKLTAVVNNNLQSLRSDLKLRNIDSDPRDHMSRGEMAALELLHKYRKRGEDEQQKRRDKAGKMIKDLGLQSK